MARKLEVGMRVQTPLGLATIVGFEWFNERGFSRPLASHDTGGRIAVQLDEPDNWLFSKSGAIPYMFRSDLAGTLD